MKSIKLLSVALLGAVLFGSCSSKEYYLEPAYSQQTIKIASSETKVAYLSVGNGLTEDDGILIAYNVNKAPAFSTARNNGNLNLFDKAYTMANEYWKSMGKSYFPTLTDDISIPEGDDDGLVISLIDNQGTVYAKENNKTQGVFEYHGETKFMEGLGIRLENTNSFAAINVAVEAVLIKCKYE